MKPKTVRILRRAQADLLEISRYLARESGDLGRDLVDDLLRAIVRLGRFPHSGAVPRDPRLRSQEYRYLIRGRYLVFYKLAGAQVRIYRVLHQRRGYERLL